MSMLMITSTTKAPTLFPDDYLTLIIKYKIELPVSTHNKKTLW